MTPFKDINATTRQRVTEIFKSLSDDTRLRILHLLIQAPSSVGHISQTLNLSQSNVSHQLRILKQARLVHATRQGQSKIYRLDDEHVANLLTQALDHAAHPSTGG